MKKIITLLVFIFIVKSTMNSLPVVTTTIIVDEKNPFKDMDHLIEAIGYKESMHNDYAMGDLTEFDSILNGIDTAYGYLQITNDCILDINETYGTHYRSIDTKGNRKLSIKIFHRYIARYATLARLGREPTQEDIARIWNGGPNGYKKETTMSYWQDVKSYLKKSRS